MTRRTRHWIDETGKCLLGLGLGYWLLNWLAQAGWVKNAAVVAMFLCSLGALCRIFGRTGTSSK